MKRCRVDDDELKQRHDVKRRRLTPISVDVPQPRMAKMESFVVDLRIRHLGKRKRVNELHETRCQGRRMIMDDNKEERQGRLKRLRLILGSILGHYVQGIGKPLLKPVNWLLHSLELARVERRQQREMQMCVD